MTPPAATDAPGIVAGTSAEPTVGPLRPRSLHRAGTRGHAEPARSWTPIGTLEAGVLADVDGAGAVRLVGADWSLDWWIGAEDRWHHPSRESTVRQQAPGSAPVVETAMRIPGGDVLCRTYGVVARAGEWRGPAVVVEVENLSSVPVALAFAVRPLTLDGPGSVRSVRSDGPVVSIDGAPRMLLIREPARVVSGPLDTVAERLVEGDDAAGPLDAASGDGRLEAAFVVPLTHTAVARVLLPVTGADDRRAAAPGAPWDAPDVDAVTSGWSRHGGDLWTSGPEPEWDAALTWADRMLRLAGPDEVGAGLDRGALRPVGPPAAVRAAEVAEAMARCGAADALLPIARGLADAQRLGGEVRMGDRSDATVALLHAAAGAMAGADPDAAAVELLIAPAAVAIRRIRRGKGTAGGLVGSAARALSMLAPVLDRVGQPDVADDARSAAASVSGSGDDDPAPSPSSDNVVRSTFATALGVRTSIARRSPDAVAGLRAVWSGASWRGRSDAERVDDGAPVAVGVLGFDAAELAARTNALLDFFVSSGAGPAFDAGVSSGEGPAFLPVFDPVWVGRSIEAHEVPTPWGTTGFAVRWHGRRPAVLWEVAGAATDRPAAAGRLAEADRLEVTADGLDGGWVGRGSEGEALLAEIPVPETAVLIRLGGASDAPNSAGSSSAAREPDGTP